MHCPKCQCDEISATGMCLWCGYQLTGPDAELESIDRKGGDESAKPRIGLTHNPDEPAREELPQWRQELSQRLRSIKKKREASKVKVQAQAPPKTDSVAEPQASPPEQPESSVLQAVDSEQMPRPPTQPRGSRRRTTPKREPQAAPPPVPEPMPELKSEPELQAADPLLAPLDLEGSQDSFDDLFSRQFRPPEVQNNGDSDSKKIRLPAAALDPHESRAILAYRGLSGIFDLLIIALSTAILIIAAALFSGVRVMASGHYIYYAILFLLVYFVYSLLFLGISSQTIGMMLLNLKVIGPGEKHPQAGRALARSCGFLLSIGCIGLGLVWAFFDRDRQCLHDRLTNTRVVRTGASL